MGIDETNMGALEDPTSKKVNAQVKNSLDFHKLCWLVSLGSR